MVKKKGGTEKLIVRSKKSTKQSVPQIFSLFFFIFIFTALVTFLYFLTNVDRCDSWECFNDNLKLCERTEFIGGDDMIFEYSILGEFGSYCRVDAKLLQANLGVQESLRLEDKSMICDIPLGVVIIPESDIGNCHGLLKEALQDQIIEKLYSYVVSNIGQISLEVLDSINE
jgi:hypothetical protein